MKKIIYVDMDDTICHFSQAFLKSVTRNPKIAFPQSQYGFFLNLEPIEGAIENVNKLTSLFDVYILSRPSVMNPLCYTEKRVWVEKHFNLEFCQNLILCSNKSLLKGNFLIDDVLWEKFEGEQILFNRFEENSWNKIYSYLKEKV